jgi:hypothetical protein
LTEISGFYFLPQVILEIIQIRLRIGTSKDWKDPMKSSAPFPNNGPVPSRHPALSDKMWRDVFHARPKEKAKKPQSSASLFWDWRKDIKDSIPPKEIK